LTKYCDRNHRDKPSSPGEQNWNHLYTDWETLKARHAIQLNPKLHEGDDQSSNKPSKEMAIALFNLYFQDEGIRFENEKLWGKLAGDNTDLAIMTWINDLVQVGWQLCRNSAP
jgi:CRISPR-associated protein Cmr2